MFLRLLVFSVAIFVVSGNLSFSNTNFEKQIRNGPIILSTIITAAAINGYAVDDAERIVGGQNVTIQQFPWQASLYNASSGRHACGGTILDRYTILTAAHCIRDGRPLGVRVGSSFHSRGGYTRSVSRIVVHDLFNRTNLDQDIALVILTFPLLWSDSVRPANLPEFEYDLDNNSTVWVSGWGKLKQDARELPEQLQAVDVQTIDQEDCRQAYRAGNGTRFNVTDNMFCAGVYGVGGRDSCQVWSKQRLHLSNG